MAAELSLSGKKVLAVGLARTGLATALFCAARGASVTATDFRDEQQLGEVPQKLRDADVHVSFGEPSPKLLHGQELVVPSPGVPADVPLLQQARAQNIPVWSEI